MELKSRQKTALRAVSLIAVISCLMIVLAYGKAQCDYLRLGLLGKKVVAVSMVTYEGEIYASGIEESITLTEEESLASFKAMLDYQNVALERESPILGIIILTLEDQSSLSAFVYEDALGFDYGRVRLRTKDLMDLFE